MSRTTSTLLPFVLLLSIATLAKAGVVIVPSINLSLNLRYDYPGDTSLGGSWDLMASTDAEFGISSLVVVLDNIDFGSVTLNPEIDGVPIESQQSGSIVEFVWGYDPGAPAGVGKFADVGNGAGTPGNVAKDDLFPIAPNSYDNMALIASGTFGAVRPSFATYPGAGGGPTAGAVWVDAEMTRASSLDPIIVYGGIDGVRGDSLDPDGLLPGDVDRDGRVDNADLLTILNSFFENISGWDNGDVAGNDGFIGNDDLLDVLNNFFAEAMAPPLTAVPEPATFALMASMALALAGPRRYVR